MSIGREPIVLRKEVSIRQGSSYTVNYYTVSVTSKNLPVERKGVMINRETNGVVVEQEYHQGGCALREREIRQ